MPDVTILSSSVQTNSTIAHTAQFIYDTFFTNIVIAVIILISGLVIGQVVKRLLLLTFSEFKLNEILQKTMNVQTKFDDLLSTIISWIIYIFAVLFALLQIGLSTIFVNILFIFVLILILVLLFLSLKDFIPNLIAGLIMHNKKYFRVGDTITLHLVEGKVDSFDLFQTIVKKKNNDLIYVPNSYIVKHRVKVKKTA
ncbi:MAG: mechanosensitive ion channel domain-containing protein [Candidatus Woesearchaeota archaeon]